MEATEDINRIASLIGIKSVISRDANNGIVETTNEGLFPSTDHSVKLSRRCFLERSMSVTSHQVLAQQGVGHSSSLLLTLNTTEQEDVRDSVTRLFLQHQPRRLRCGVPFVIQPWPSVLFFRGVEKVFMNGTTLQPTVGKG